MLTGKELAKLRKAMGLSREALADRLGVSGVTVWRWERGESPIRKPEEIAILEVLSDGSRP